MDCTDKINSVGNFVGKNDTLSFFLLCFNFVSHGNSLGIFVCIYQFSGSGQWFFMREKKRDNVCVLLLFFDMV